MSASPFSPLPWGEMTQGLRKISNSRVCPALSSHGPTMPSEAPKPCGRGDPVSAIQIDRNSSTVPLPHFSYAAVWTVPHPHLHL